MNVNAKISRIWLVCALIIAATFGFASHVLGREMSLAASMVVLVLSMLIFGIAHGALDHLVATKLWRQYMSNTNAGGVFQPMSALKFQFIFLLAYAALALLVVVIWHHFPVYSLVFFLVVSAFHFGEDLRLVSALHNTSRPQPFLRMLVSIVLGGAIIVTPWVFHTADVTAIFAWLSRTTPTDWQGEYFLRSLWVYLALLSILFITLVRHIQLIDFLEWLAIVLLFIFAPPLVAFALFFSFLHALQHMVKLSDFLYRDRVSPRQAFLRTNLAALPLTIMTVIASIAVWWYWLSLTPDQQAFGVNEAEQRIAEILFIGLAALTMPHMLLVAYWDWRHRREFAQPQA
jgi:beta-carotene 15,15'-dioxygenase